MSDLISIFRKTPQQQRKSFQSKNSSYLSPYERIRDGSIRSSPYDNINLTPQSSRSDSLDILLNTDNQMKKIITQNTMKQEIDWFKNNLRLEGFINIVINFVIILICCKFNLFGFSMAITLFIYSFFLFGVSHCFFGAGIIVKWAKASLYATYLVLIYLIFAYFMENFSNEFIKKETYFTSLLPSVQLTIVLLIFVEMSSTLFQQDKSPRSLLENLVGMVTDMSSLLERIFLAKYSILLVYGLILIVQIIALNSLEIFANRKVSEIISPIIFGSQICTTILIFCINYFLKNVIKETISNWILFSSYSIGESTIPLNYNKRKINTVPMILELLRLDTSSTCINGPRQSKTQRQFSQIMYCKSMKWILNLLAWNPDSLNTKIQTSKFYNTYWDIFKQFSQRYLKITLFKTLQWEQDLLYLKKISGHKKTFKEDLLYQSKLIRQRMRVWRSGVQWAINMKTTDFIIRILLESNYPQVSSPILVQKYLSEINEKINIANNIESYFIGPILAKKVEITQKKMAAILQRHK